jgi:hypothetical protein
MNQLAASVPQFPNTAARVGKLGLRLQGTFGCDQEQYRVAREIRMSETKTAGSQEQREWLFKLLGIALPPASGDENANIAEEDFQAYLLPEQATPLLDKPEALLKTRPAGAPAGGSGATTPLQNRAVSGMPGFTKRLAGLMPAVNATLSSGQAGAQDIRQKVAEAGAAARNQDFPQAYALLADTERLLQSPRPAAPTERPPPSGGSSSGPPDAGAAIAGEGQEKWRAARSAAVAALTNLEGAVRKSSHPDRDGAIIMLRAIRANLPETPDTPQKVGELERYLTTDDIIDAAETPNVFGVNLALRAPLLEASAAVRAQLNAELGGRP